MGVKLLINILLFSAILNLYAIEEEITTKPRIAITVQNANGEPLADSIMTRLSSQNITCLERTQIKKILAEQKLSSSGLVDPANVLKCSRLLSVDIFVVIICSPQTEAPIGVIAFDAKRGIRLIDINLPENFEEQINSAANKIVNAISKSQLLNDDKLKLISFLPLNLIALQGEEAKSAQLVELIIMRLMGQGKDTLILERKQLDFLLKERTLNATAQSQLLGGSIFIQLETGLNCDKTNPLFIELSVKDISGKTRFSIRESYAIGGETDIATKMSAEIKKKLGLMATSNTFDRIAEAQKYLKDCRLAQANGMFDRASQLARNVYLLNPKFKRKIIEILMQNVKTYLYFSGTSPLHKDLEAAVEDIELIFEFNGNSNDTVERAKKIMHYLSEMSYYYFENKISPQLRARIIKLRTEATLILLRNYKLKHKQIDSVDSVSDMENIAKRIKEINEISHITWDSSINTQYGLPLKELYVANVDRFHTNKVFPLHKGFDLFAPGKKPLPLFALNRLYRSMQNTSDPYFKIIGTLHLYSINYSKSFKDPSYVNFLIGVINKYEIPDKEWENLKRFFIIGDVGFLSGNPGKLGLKLCDTIYERKGFDYVLFSRINYDNKDDAFKGYALMKRIQKNAINNTNLNDKDRKKLIKETDWHIKKLMMQFPQCKFSTSTKIVKVKLPGHYFDIVPSGELLSQPLYDGKYIYAVRIIDAKRFLYKIFPENRFKYKAGQQLLMNYRQLENASFENYFACLSEKNYIMATSAGLFIFPLNLSKPQFIPLKEFKGFSCYDVVCLNGKIYISYNDRRSSNSKKTPVLLVEYDLTQKIYSVVYASHQSDNNPFAKYFLDHFEKIYADADHNRLIIPIWGNSKKAEIWTFKPISKTWKKISTLPYYPRDYQHNYSPFIIRKNKANLVIIGNNVVYEFDTFKNQYKFLFYSGDSHFLKGATSNTDSVMKKYSLWKSLLPNWRHSDIKLVHYDDNKLLSSYRLIFPKEKKAVNLIKLSDKRRFLYAYFLLKNKNVVIGSGHNCVPNRSLMAFELDSDEELLKNSKCFSIAP